MGGMKRRILSYNRLIYLSLAIFGLIVITAIVCTIMAFTQSPIAASRRLLVDEDVGLLTSDQWVCRNNFCQKVYQGTNSTVYFKSLSRCHLICMGPQLWPQPVGYTYFSKTVVALSTKKLEYRLQSVPSERVHQYLVEAFKWFLGNLVRLEKVYTGQRKESDLLPMKLNIVIEVDSDADPRLRYDTDESYTVKFESSSQVEMRIAAASFCGARHGLETLSQMILLDHSSGFLVTLSNSLVRDAPSYRYRGLMIDTARNYIPVEDLMRTLDGMATVKLNTFHWRISDTTSFPLYLAEVPQLFQYGAYDRSMVYTKMDVKSIVHRAGIRGIRVVIEVAAPRPVGRAWSWSPDASCPRKTDNSTCDNVLCLRLEMRDSVFNVLQAIYQQIINLTKVDDVFHLSDGLFSLSNCYFVTGDRGNFLVKALERLKVANKGVMPKLPIIWYTSRLTGDLEAAAWDKYGVQLHEWVQNPEEKSLGRFRVVHSSRWGLSCQMKGQRCAKYRSWQEMYSWKSWRNIEVFAIEGGEAILWTDLVDSGNLDYHLWPRACAVAERLWSNVVANATASPRTYARLDAHRWQVFDLELINMVSEALFFTVPVNTLGHPNGGGQTTNSSISKEGWFQQAAGCKT